MRLLVLADARSVHTERWCRFFEETGWEVALFSLEPKTIAWPRRFFAGRRPTGFGLVDYALARRRFRKVVETFQPEIISAHFVGSYGWLASFTDRHPVVVTAWGSDLLMLTKQSTIHRRRTERALVRAVLCTVDAEVLFRAAAEFVPESKIMRVVFGPDEEMFHSVKKTSFSTSGPMRIIAPRGMATVYDPLTIIAAAAELKSTLAFHLDIMGEGKAAKRMAREISARSLNELISLYRPKPRDEYLRGLAGCDVYLSASLSDSTSVSLLEAMSVGLFPVVSDVAGNREWISSGRNGLLFKPGSSGDLAESLRRAEELRPQFQTVAEQNREIIQRRALWPGQMGPLKERMIQLCRR